MSELKRSVAAQLDEQRKRLGLQRIDVARRLGIGPANMTKLFRGRRNLTLRTLVEIAQALNATVSVTITPKNAPTKENADVE